MRLHAGAVVAQVAIAVEHVEGMDVQVLVVAEWRRLAARFGVAQFFLIAVSALLVLSRYAERPWNCAIVHPVVMMPVAFRRVERLAIPQIAAAIAAPSSARDEVLGVFHMLVPWYNPCAPRLYTT